MLCMGGQLSLLKELTNLHYNFCQCFHIANFTNFFVGTAGGIGGRAAAAWRLVIACCWYEQQPLKEYPPDFAPTVSILNSAHEYRSNGGQWQASVAPGTQPQPRTGILERAARLMESPEVLTPSPPRCAAFFYLSSLPSL